MEAPAIRQRLTLSDQLSSIPSTNLRDLLKVRDEGANGRRNGTLTLATVLEAEKNATSAAASAGGSLTLLDVIQEEETGGAASAASSTWRELRDRIPIRRGATWTVGSGSGSTERTDGSGSESESGSRTVRLSLMALMELREREEEEGGGAAVMAVGAMDCGADVAAEEVEEEEEEKMAGREKHVCCVCMVRKKGAAFIPCGHTFCRVCGRDLFVGRGNCPLCNASIAEVLRIF